MRSAVQVVFRVIYWAWFYILAAIPILLLLPVLVIASFFEKGYVVIYWIARNIWASFILCGMWSPVKFNCLDDTTDRGIPYMITPNHQSALDIMIVLRLSKNPVLFVGKRELVNIPIFGFIYKKVAVTVDRSSANSRAKVYTRVEDRLKSGYSICIFPEGKVPHDSVQLDAFHPGAFKMAIQNKLDILPVSILNANKRLSYYYLGRPGSIEVCIHPHIDTSEVAYENYSSLMDQTRNRILSGLR